MITPEPARRPPRARTGTSSTEAAGAPPPVNLAWNENPWGPSPRALEAARHALAAAHRYPECLAPPLRVRLARRLGVPEPWVLLGSGSSELIGLLVQAFCGPTDEVLAPAYSFACYRMSCEGHRRPYREVPATSEFTPDVEALAAAASASTKLVFLANPNNPTGTYVRRADFERLLDRLPSHVVLAVDEAYLEYARADDYPDTVSYLARRERLVALRTFSKVHGLAGMRVGYAVAPPALLDALEGGRLPFSVNAVGQAAACAALDDDEHVERSWRSNTTERRRLTESLRGLGLLVAPTQANFLLVGLLPFRMEARAAAQALLRRGVVVRPLESYGLSFHLRITVGTEAHNTQLLTAIRAVLGV